MSHNLRVGAPYNSNRRSWPEGAEYNFRGGEHELLLLFPDPSAEEIAAVATGEAELALFVEQPAVLLLYRFGGEGGSPWSDAPYTWHLVPAYERPLPTDEEQTALRVVLVDAGDGIVKALRLVLLAPGFTKALHDAIHAQAATPWNAKRYDAKLKVLYERFPKSAEMARAAGHLTTLSPKTGEKREA
jgi:hypothetical protein